MQGKMYSRTNLPPIVLLVAAFACTVSAQWSVFIDCGGSGLNDSSTQVQWLSDRFFTGGTAANNGARTVTGSVGGAQGVYQTERYGPSTYRIPVPSAGTYNVTFSFVEIYWTGPNLRLFNVNLQGTQVIASLDIFAVTGGINRLHQRTFTAQVSSPLSILVTTSIVRDNPTLVGLGVRSISTSTATLSPTAGPSQTPTGTGTQTPTSSSTPTVSLTPAPSGTASQTRTSSLTPTASAGPTQTPAASFTLSPSAGPTQAPTLTPASTVTWSVYVDCGGTGLVESGTQVQWLSDRYFTGGTAASNGGRTVTGAVGGAQAVYRTERWGPLSYNIPVPFTGQYTVTISFVEIFFTGANQRLFNVFLQGVQVITSLDIFAVAGGRDVLVQRTFTVQVGASLSISLTTSAVVDNPTMVGLSVILVQPGPTPVFTSAPPTSRPSPTFSFVHPGVLVSKGQLDFVRAQSNAGVEPFATAYAKAKASVFGSLTYMPMGPPNGVPVQCGPFTVPDIGCTWEDMDSAAALTQALLWYISGNVTYANNAIRILNAYARGLLGHTNTNAGLQAAWSAQKFPAAAEIMRYTNANWSDTDFTAFKTMLQTRFLNVMTSGSVSGKNGNWAVSWLDGTLGIAIVTENKALFDSTIQTMRGIVPALFYSFTEDGTQPATNALVSTSWNGQSTFNAATSGIGQETCRDLKHPQLGLVGILNFFETAYIQGTDLFTTFRTRMSGALEFHANLFNINPAFGPTSPDFTLGSVPSAICSRTVQMYQMGTFEVGYNAYANRMGMNMTNTLRHLNNYVRRLSLDGALHVEINLAIFETLHHGGSP
mmetsp:Transcript_19481/g.32428  ORF Transcript_19481/g.32428 Transcript_19481/m.32428 type:complete len:821 (+) Transcript_19481:61-2523(+)